MTANEVARESGWAIHDWAEGDRATNEAFAPIETYGERFDALLGRARALGFGTIDLWGAHLGPGLGDRRARGDRARGARPTRAHGRDLRDLDRPGSVDRACELARAVGTSVIGGGFSGEAAALAPVLRKHGVTLAIENHPERTPDELLAKIEAGEGTMAATVDTGWWGTQGYDPVRAIEELGGHVAHVHLKDVLRRGEPHDTCAWGEGVVDIEACVRALARLGYRGALAVEHEPEDRDPTEEIRAMRQQLEEWVR